MKNLHIFALRQVVSKNDGIDEATKKSFIVVNKIRYPGDSQRLISIILPFWLYNVTPVVAGVSKFPDAR